MTIAQRKKIFAKWPDNTKVYIVVPGESWSEIERVSSSRSLDRDAFIVKGKQT